MHPRSSCLKGPNVQEAFAFCCGSASFAPRVWAPHCSLQAPRTGHRRTTLVCAARKPRNVQGHALPNSAVLTPSLGKHAEWCSSHQQPAQQFPKLSGHDQQHLSDLVNRAGPSNAALHHALLIKPPAPAGNAVWESQSRWRATHWQTHGAESCPLCRFPFAEPAQSLRMSSGHYRTCLDVMDWDLCRHWETESAAAADSSVCRQTSC
mmetsp:Transcript_52986/g.95312  ORF Transcript_52986/g.95312 Transcript_52986/m.95312 type:complete len:207 (-) Transcript_52986:1411-2031(-)